MRRKMSLVLLLAVVVIAGALVPVGRGGAAQPAAQPTDCVNWRYGPGDEPAPGVLPTELDRDSYKVASRRDSRPTCSRHRTTSAVRRAPRSTLRSV